MKKKKLLRLTTVDISLDILIKGQLRYMSGYFDVVAVSADTGRLEAVGKREGVRTVAVPMAREISIGRDIRSLFALISLFRRERPDIVHANTPKGSLLAMMAAFVCRVPHRIYLVTGFRFETTHGLLRFVLKTMERITCLCANKVVPESDGVARLLRSEHITWRPLKKTHNGNINGVDLAYFSRTPEVEDAARALRSEAFTFIFIGRIVRDKGVNELVEAFVRLHAENPATRLLLVGKFEEKLDPLSSDTRRTIEEHPAIETLGYQADVRPALCASRALVLPSYREGFPNVVLQAGAMGLPSVASRVNGAEECIIEGRNGLLVPCRDAESLFRSMQRLAGDPELCNRMGAAAREIVASRYMQQDVWAATLAMYKEELSR
ncbi:MAG: glycosyltransferase family 4 protein [Prevotellaceae bacterium]|nr:glycosyltransferase family 4 protein [Prevotellaceae bacterium]